MNENSENSSSTTDKKNDTLAFIIGGLFILGLVFATYNYFNESGRLDSTKDENGVISLEKLKETLSTKTGDEKEDQVEMLEEDEDSEAEEKGISEDTAKMAWKANEYDEGDIREGEYEVKYGDTLWEIAEAVYGNGAMWTNILEANSSSVGYLPNGQQSLIYAGQTIIIPTL